MTPGQIPKKIDLHLEFDTETGQVNVRGPLQMKPMCIRILTIGIQVVLDHEPPNVVPALKIGGDGKGMAN